MNTGLGSVTIFALLIGFVSLFQGKGFENAFMLAGICFFIGLVWKFMTGAGGGVLTGILMVFGLGWLFGGDDEDDEG